MSNLFSAVGRKVFPKPAIKQLRNFKSLAMAHGQWASIRRGMCVDKEESPIPWYTYPAIEFLRGLDFSEASIFEYGSGNSSLWWALRSRDLVSIESDPSWHARISGALRSMNNVDYRLCLEKRDYVQSPGVSKADVVVIDGKHRFDCTRHLIGCLGEGHHNCQFIIFDNSDWYPRSISELAGRLGWIQVDFSGFGPINDYTWTTSIFLNPHQTLATRRSKSLGSVSGIAKVADDD